MTICMGAICRTVDGSGPAVVLASDRMVTMGQITEFEHTVPKAHTLTSHVLCLIAGDALQGVRVAKETASQCSPHIASVEDLAGLVAQTYCARRLAEAETRVLSTRGLNMHMFYQMHQQMVGQIVVALDNQIANFDLGIELLVAGVDDAGGHIFDISNPGGQETCLDPIGFHAIGSGALHAIQSMIEFRHSPSSSLPETMFRVFASKRRAEVAPGVGSDTDIAVITEAGRPPLPSNLVNELDRLYNQALVPAGTQYDGVVATLAALLQGGAA
jgi:20S proteasome alpha/beta subunit